MPSFPEPNKFPNTSVVTAKQLAKDYHTLSKLLHRLNLKPRFVAGPDVTQGGEDFLEGYIAIHINTLASHALAYTIILL